jgi:hypothetical protein
LGNPEGRKMSGCSSEVVGIGDRAEVATLEAVAPLAKTEELYEMKYCSGRAREVVRARIDIEAVLVDRPVEGSCDSVAGRTGDVVWEEGASVAPGRALHNRRTCLSCTVPVVYSNLLLTRTVSSPWRERNAILVRPLHRLTERCEDACKRRQGTASPSCLHAVRTGMGGAN